MTTSYTKQPRLYINAPLRHDSAVDIGKDQAHYLRNVLRMGGGDHVRIFNGRDGEWLCEISELSKKAGRLKSSELLREQTAAPENVHLLFPPLKKARQDFLIEKAVELGVTHLHPCLSEFTQVRNINEDRINAQITEAVEQCERLDIPTLKSLRPLRDIIANWPKDTQLLACIERAAAQNIMSAYKNGPIAIIIGPEGGWSEEEKLYLQDRAVPVGLGDNILRAETAALAALSVIKVSDKIKSR